MMHVSGMTGMSRNDESDLLRQSCSSAGQRAFASSQEARGIGGEGVAVLLAAEQIEPLSRDQPEPGVAGHGDAARHVDRVVAAELRAVDIGMGDEGGAVALVVETPDRPGLGGLELLPARAPARASTK